MKKLLFLLVASLWLSGCAAMTETIELSYNSHLDITKAPRASDVVVSVKANDQRQDIDNIVSWKKNLFGMKLAPIMTGELVTVTLRRAIEQELRSRGFTIGSEASVFIVADLTKFWNDFKFGFFAGDSSAELSMTISVQDKNENVLYSKYILAEGTEENIQLMNGKNARLALEKALANGVKLLFGDPAFMPALLGSSK